MQIRSKALIKGFHESLQGHPRFGKYSHAQIDECCRALFSFIFNSIESSEFPEIVIRRWGRFYVRPGKVWAMLKYYLKVKDTSSDPEIVTRAKDQIPHLYKYLESVAPELLERMEEPDRFYISETIQRNFNLKLHDKGPRKPEEHQSLDPGQSEIQTVLQPKPDSEETPEDPYSRTNWFSHFFHEE